MGHQLSKCGLPLEKLNYKVGSILAVYARTLKHCSSVLFTKWRSYMVSPQMVPLSWLSRVVKDEVTRGVSKNDGIFSLWTKFYNLMLHENCRSMIISKNIPWSLTEKRIYYAVFLTLMTGSLCPFRKQQQYQH